MASAVACAPPRERISSLKSRAVFRKEGSSSRRRMAARKASLVMAFLSGKARPRPFFSICPAVMAYSSIWGMAIMGTP